eukprot:14538970-Alexandrium_andersonii.AAC.1
MALTGTPERAQLCIFGETVRYLHPKGSENGKAQNRWKLGVWTGISDTGHSHIILTPGCVVQARKVQRRSRNSRWSIQHLNNGRGLPWDAFESAEEAQPARPAPGEMARSEPDLTDDSSVSSLDSDYNNSSG